MAAQTFGVVIPGRPVDTNFQQVDANKFLVTIQDAESVNHMVIFLTNPLPPEAACCIFFSLPDPNAVPTWHYLGYLTNQKPSAIYKLSNLTRPKTTQLNVGQIGISIEPFSSEITQMVPAIETAASSTNSFAEFINKTINNLHNYCTSFSKSAEELAASVNPFQQSQSIGDNQYVPLKCIQTWYENYIRRLSNDQNFWKTLSN